MEKFAKFIITHRWWFITLICTITIACAYRARNIKTDNSIEIWLKQDDPSLKFYNEFKKNFGNEEFLIIAINNDNIFTRQFIKNVSKASDAIKKIDGVKDVTSLSSVLRKKIDEPLFRELLLQKTK